MPKDDRYGTAARLSALERQLAILGRHVQVLEDTNERLVREVRSFRVKLAALEERDAWVENFRNDERDPFAALGPSVKPRAGSSDTPRTRQP